MCELLLRRLGVRRARLDASGWLPLMRAGVPIGVVSLLMIVLLRLDVTMLSFLSDAATVGVYAVAFRLVEATQFMGGAMAMAMLPWLARAGDEPHARLRARAEGRQRAAAADRARRSRCSPSR